MYSPGLCPGGNRPVAIVSDRMARETWGGLSSSLGRRIRIGNIGEWCEIIGVVGDVHDEGPQQRGSSTVYWRAGVQPGIMGAPSSAPRSMVFAIRSARAGNESLLAEIRQAVWTVDPNLPLALVRTLADVYNGSMARTSFTLVMLAIAASMALGLGVVGIYGVISLSVASRRRELAIRSAVGAQQSDIRRLIFGEGFRLIAGGVLAGLALAEILSRVLRSFLFEVQPGDPATFIVVAALFVGVGLLACWTPVRRAGRVNPLEALR